MNKITAITASLGVLVPALAARAHESVIPHVNPHERAIDGALLGFDTLALVALVVIAVTGGWLTLARVRARRKK